MSSMPTPERTSLGAIVEAARETLESDGLSGLTMQAVAKRVGVRAPSLYKRLEGREELIRLVAEATFTDLAARLDVETDLIQLATSFRRFGHDQPAAFLLVMTPGPGVPTARPEFVRAASDAVRRSAGVLAGDEHALDAARTLTSWAVGFISMELNGGFNLGGDIEGAWEFGLERIVFSIGASR